MESTTAGINRLLVSIINRAKEDDDSLIYDWAVELRAILASAQLATPESVEELAAGLARTLRDIRDNWDCDDYAHSHGTTCRCCQANDAVLHYDRALLARASRADGWISTKEILPQECKYVLIHTRNSVGQAYYFDGDWKTPSGDWYSGRHVTNWMPLPEHPKESAE